MLDALPAGTHQVRAEFAYDGGGIGRGGTVTLYVDPAAVADGRVERTHPLHYSFDEGFGVGCDTGMPVYEGYGTPRGRFTGTTAWGPDRPHSHLVDPEGHLAAVLRHQ